MYFNLLSFLQSGGAVGWGTVLQVGRSQVVSPMELLKFFIDLILPAALWLLGWLNLWQKWVRDVCHWR